jgi:hypothetical protein
MVNMLEMVVLANIWGHGLTLEFSVSESRAKIEISMSREGYVLASVCLRNCSMGERTLSFGGVEGMRSGAGSPTTC